MRNNTEVIASKSAFEGKIDTVAQLQQDLAVLKTNRDEAKEVLLKDWNAKIKALENEIKTEQTAVQSYAELHWEKLAGDKAKTAHTTLANYGFRTGQPTVKLKLRKKEAEVAQELHDAGHEELVEVVYKLNKKSILRALNNGVEAIVRIFKRDQKERFFIEAKAHVEN